jgi:hypothetical protein
MAGWCILLVVCTLVMVWMLDDSAQERPVRRKEQWRLEAKREWERRYGR